MAEEIDIYDDLQYEVSGPAKIVWSIVGALLQSMRTHGYGGQLSVHVRQLHTLC
jgi:hypothetical protein